MKVSVDSDRCMGHAMCAARAPEVYHVTEESGMNEMGAFEVPDALADAATRGARACPERIITVDGVE